MTKHLLKVGEPIDPASVQFPAIRIPIGLLRRLKPAPLLVYGLLLRYAAERQGYPALERIAEELNMSSRSVQRHLAILEKRRLIHRIEMNDGCGAQGPNTFIFRHW